LIYARKFGQNFLQFLPQFKCDRAIESVDQLLTEPVLLLQLFPSSQRRFFPGRAKHYKYSIKIIRMQRIWFGLCATAVDIKATAPF